MRNGTSVALLALGLSLAAPASAQPVDEIGASVWHTVSVFEGFGFREALAVSADTYAAPWLRLRPGLRASSAGDILGSALRQPSVPILGRFHEISPSFSMLAGGDVGPARIQGGVGLAYHVRITLTDEAVVGFPIVPTGTTSFGTIKSLGLTFDPGIDAVAEAAFVIPLGFRLVVGFGGSFAGARLLVQTREDPAVEISQPRLFFHWSFQLGLRWSLKGDGKPPPSPPATPSGPP
jgi:hypothetical protein